ncbi:MAG: hypothetical protein K1X94_18635 [Sandaracinaceae bacterium]|nr:hypothetical protein [Sandaracinaceae bacterium]
MTSPRTLFVAFALVFVAACGGGTEESDSGRVSMDAPSSDTPVVRTDAPGLDAPGLDAPGLDAPSTTDDAFSAEDAPSTTDDAFSADDAPSTADDAFVVSEDAPASADAPAIGADTGGARCGGIAGTPCRGRGVYCDADCNVFDAEGVCRVMPTVCTDEVNPMCGCDGMTYGNPCMAAMAGVSVRSVGACPSDCRTMGCRAGLTCCTSGRSAGSCYAPGCLACCM